ncbi:MAG: DNA primase [Rhodobacteraceae bacterium]|nr:DNA primase [Paracoccaceae bacterium]
MSLPPGFLDELRNRASLSRVVGRKVTWDNRKTNQGKGDYWAPCPFHQEKTASFHVDDKKGYYYCFGCHAKGDALSFVRETENVGFMEAVEILAREAGMQMPARDPEAAARLDRQGELVKVMEAAVQHYRLQLKTGAGAAARDYLNRRKLGEATQDRFDIGFAPDQRQGLFQALTAKGMAADLLVDAGLCARPDDGGPPYDRFRDRIIFPIRDARGRCIGLGGRAMDPNARAKYLNSPETELFDKGRSLYNHGPAREAAGKGLPLIVAEGYMDVIALVSAGFEAAVAPLGTAITEDQLRLLWRIHPEPIIALDGDTAGIRAATRLVDLALPLLEAGQGLRFVILPEGMDPDDLIQMRGREAMAKYVAEAQPMANLLWRRETEGRVFDSPERKAALRRSLRESITRIRDKDIRRYYAEVLKHYEWRDFGPPAFERRFDKRRKRENLVLEETKSSLLARDSAHRAIEYMRETAIIAVCLTRPDAIAAFEAGLERLEMIEPGHWKILQVILANYASDDNGSLYLRVCDSVGREAIEKIMDSAHIRVLPPIKNPEDYDLCHDTLAEQMAKLESDRGHRREVEEAEADMDGLVDEGLTWRLLNAVEARNRANRPKLDDSSDMGEDRAALSAQLQGLIDSAAWIKKRH